MFACYLMWQEMLNARIDQARAISEIGRSLALGLQKEVDDGIVTKEAALAEFGRLGNAIHFDNGSGYLFANTQDGVTILAPNPKQIGQNRLNEKTNGRPILRELSDGVAAKGDVTLTYDYAKPGETELSRKLAYAVAIPGWNMYVGTGAYLDDLDAKLKPLAWMLGLSILGIAVIAGGIAWLISRSISKPLGQLRTRMRALADGSLEGDIPGTDVATRSAPWRRRFKSSRTMPCVSAGSRRPRKKPTRVPPPSAVASWRASPMISNAASTASSARFPPPRRECRARRNR